MTKTVVLYAALEGLLALLFVTVLLTQGLRVWAYWALLGVFVLNLLLGLALLRGAKGPRRRK